MKCPNCLFDNLDSSSFCAKCGKPFSYARNGIGATESLPKKKRKASKKSSARKPSIKKTSTTTKKRSESTKRKPKNEMRTVPLKKMSPKEGDTRDRKNILKGVEITPLDNVIYEGAEKEDGPIPMASENGSSSPQLEPLATANAELPKVLWPELQSQIRIEELVSDAQEKTELREEAPPKRSLQDRVQSLRPFARFLSMIRNLAPKGPFKPLTRRFFYIGAALLAGTAVWIALVKPLVLDRARASKTPAHPVLAVMNFVNNTNQDRFEPWSKALPFALATHLSHSSDIHVLSPERVFSALQGSVLWEQDRASYSRSDLKELAAMTNADLILIGSLADNGGSIQIETAVKRTKDGNDLFEDSRAVSSESEILAHAGSLAQRIDEELNTSRTENGPVGHNNNGVVNSPIPDAYKQYVQGQWQFWQKQYRGSILAYESALELDPEFAQAYVEMGKAYAALGYLSRAAKHYQAALERIDRLTEEERLQVQGELYRLSEKTLLIAQDIYLRLLEISPDDPRTRVHLGELYTRLGLWDKAARTYELSIVKQVETPDIYLGQSMNYALQGDYKLAQETISSNIQELPDFAFFRMQLAWIHLMQGDFSAALGELERGYALHPFYALIRMKGDVLLLSEDLISASSEYGKLLLDEEPIVRLWGNQRLAKLFLLQGKFKQAREQLSLGLKEAEANKERGWSYRFYLDLARLSLERGNPRRALLECDSAWDIAMQGETREFPRQVLFLRGLAYLALRRINEAEKTAGLLKSLCEKGPGQDRMRSYLLLKGRIEMSRRNFVQAIEYIRQSVELLPLEGPPVWEQNDHALYYDALAEAFYARGDPGRAYEELNKLRALSTGRLGFGDLYARTFYKQAKISEEKLFPETAAKLYAKFLFFWGEGDPGSSDLSDARLRLRAIQGQFP